MQQDPTKRFSQKVLNYVKYRPDYPSEVIEYLKKEAGLTADYQVADIGSGTGIFTRHLLDLGCTVFAVEPNDPMRLAAEEQLSEYPNFTSVAATAENTAIPDHALDLVVSAQAFHWFNAERAKREFNRILKPGKFVAIVWNRRREDADAFSLSYDKLLQQQSPDYNEINHRKLNYNDFAAFFKEGNYEKVSFPSSQFFDEEGLIGRASSSSYVPLPDTTEGQAFITELKQLFAKHQQNGGVAFYYDTEVYLGKV